MIKLLKESKADAVFFNTQDEFLSEFTKPENNDVLQITGFTGSNGFALIASNQSLFFTDGRYTLQAKSELPPHWQIYKISSFFEVVLKLNLKTLALNFAKISTQFATKLQNVVPNLINLAKSPSNPLQINNNFYQINGGTSTEEKISQITQHTKKHNKDGFFISNPQNVCWILNVRGNDEDFTPIYKATLFIDANGTHTLNPNLEEIAGEIFIEPEITHLHFINISVNKEFSNFVTTHKAIKNKTEIEGTINTHNIDGKILTNFLFWLEENYKGKTEWEISQKLLQFRQQHPFFKMPSFTTICGCNENGAIIHYNPQKQTAKVIEENSVLLIDSGGQYLGINTLGTTDVTRTMFLGSTPPTEYQNVFTLVLKGHIALATAIFNETTPSSYFDKLARKFLKEEDKDYAHSTGHGVGAFLSVHESGCGISSKNNATLQEGMLLSNEPGYYLEGKFGIRIENLVLVCKNQEGNLYFKTITLAPIQEKSINFTLLTKTEKQWLENYNQQCIKNANV